ncbi:Uncharacterised protein [Mycobacterium tuberculosis]|nr:Uncharacterised protein [Mycobacterium tuberculosis]
MAAMGNTRTPHPSRSLISRIRRTPAGVSVTGRVLGMQATAVYPPRAAARVPVAIVSFSSKPGSRR